MTPLELLKRMKADADYEPEVVARGNAKTYLEYTVAMFRGLAKGKTELGSYFVGGREVVHEDNIPTEEQLKEFEK